MPELTPFCAEWRGNSARLLKASDFILTDKLIFLGRAPPAEVHRLWPPEQNRSPPIGEATSPQVEVLSYAQIGQEPPSLIEQAPPHNDAVCMDERACNFVSRIGLTKP